MNTTCLLFLNRRDPVLGLSAHLAAGILALVLLTGAARSSAKPQPISPTATTAAVVAHR